MSICNTLIFNVCIILYFQIADFGLSNFYSKDTLLKTFCGSPLYASPEIVNGQPYYGPEVRVVSLCAVFGTYLWITFVAGGGGGSNHMSPLKCIDYPKKRKGGGPSPELPPGSATEDGAMSSSIKARKPQLTFLMRADWGEWKSL